MLAYLAGAIEFAPDDGRIWREEISRFLTEELRHNVFNPCVEENHILTPEEFRHFRGWKQSNLSRFRQTVRKLIATDLDMLLNRVDYVICFWDEHVLRGAGTHGELTMAFHHKIPVYLVHQMAVTEMSSWILGCSTEIFPDFDSLKTFLRRRYR